MIVTNIHNKNPATPLGVKLVLYNLFTRFE